MFAHLAFRQDQMVIQMQRYIFHLSIQRPVLPYTLPWLLDLKVEQSHKINNCIRVSSEMCINQIFANVQIMIQTSTFIFRFYNY